MKGVVVMLMLIVFYARGIRAQGFFNQKSTQLKRMAEQIAALEVYKEYAKKGYKIVRDGTRTVRDIRRGDFKLHSAFFNSLKAVNPQIKRCAKVAQIIALQIGFLRQCNQHIKTLRSSGMLTEEELLYIGRVFSLLLAECAQILDELLLLTTDGKAELKDDERIQRIDALYGETQQQHVFLKSFSDQNMALASSRLAEQKDVQKIKEYYGLD